MRGFGETCTTGNDICTPRAFLARRSQIASWRDARREFSHIRRDTCTGMGMHESQQIAAERHDLAAHAHWAGAEHHGKEDHLTGHESSRQDLEYSHTAYLHEQREHQETRADRHLTAHEARQQQEIASLAYRLWQGRCCPEGSPDEDWFRAVEELRSQR
jgi:hypothetical protein